MTKQRATDIVYDLLEAASDDAPFQITIAKQFGKIFLDSEHGTIVIDVNMRGK